MTSSDDGIYFHEDDYCQQEILPLSAMDFCQAQIQEIDAFSAAHVAPGGVGWTDMFMRQGPAEKLSDLRITLDTLRSTLGKKLPEISSVYTGYSSHVEKCENAVGFGYRASSVIFADWNDDGAIRSVWTSIFTDDATEFTNVITALESLGQMFPLLYVDWAWSFAVPLLPSSTLRERLESKFTEMSRRMNTSE